MAEISAAAVKSLREKTGLPMMDCKKALQESGGDESGAMDWLRKQGIKTQETRLGRETSAGRIAVYSDGKVAAMVEVKCESPPVQGSPEFKQFANDLAKQCAMGKGVSTAEGLLKQPSLSLAGKTIAEQKDDMFNRIREVFDIGRVLKIESPCGAYAHHDGSSGALVQVEGTNLDVAKDIAMHVVANKPASINKEDLDSALVDKEKEIQMEAARKEGKPENIIAKMIEGRMKNFYASKVLLEQPFIKDDKQTVGQMAKAAGLKVLRIERWEMGKQDA